MYDDLQLQFIQIFKNPTKCGHNIVENYLIVLLQTQIKKFNIDIRRHNW